jgi:hypothetical protein
LRQSWAKQIPLAQSLPSTQAVPLAPAFGEVGTQAATFALPGTLTQVAPTAQVASEPQGWLQCRAASVGQRAQSWSG